MKIFVDSANVDDIREAAAMGVADGVTTNPSLVAKTGRSYKEVILEICEIVDGPISAEVIATDLEGMLKEGREVASWHPNIVVKIPLITEGLKAVQVLSKEGIKTNVTLCFSASQGWLAAKAGATYVSPFVGRIDDVSGDGMELIRELRAIYDNYDLETEILVASVRHPRHVVESTLIGADVATMPLSVIQRLAQHPLTDQGLAKFLSDAEKIPKN